MKSLTAKPQEWKTAAQACLTQQALDAFHAQERSSASLPAAGEGKSPTTIPTSMPTSTPVPMCTVPPRPQTYIGPAPTSTPTLTPVPPLSGQEVARGVYEAADLVDPLMPDPATVGGPDVGDLIDKANEAMQTVPPSNPIIATFKFGVSTLKVFKDTASSAVNFVCQQWERQGPYYELFPLDKQISNFVNRWNKMSTFEKVGWTIVTALILATMVALVLSL